MRRFQLAGGLAVVFAFALLVFGQAAAGGSRSGSSSGIAGPFSAAPVQAAVAVDSPTPVPPKEPVPKRRLFPKGDAEVQKAKAEAAKLAPSAPKAGPSLAA